MFEGNTKTLCKFGLASFNRVVAEGRKLEACDAGRKARKLAGVLTVLPQLVVNV